MAIKGQPYIDYFSEKFLPYWYLLAGVCVGIALGLINAVLDFMPKEVHNFLNDIIKRLQAAASNFKEGAAQTMGKVQEAANQTRAGVAQLATDGKKQINGTINRIYAHANANGHAVAAG